MNEIIKINTTSSGQQVVSARETYLALGLDSSNWGKWHKKNITNNPYAIENQDWSLLVPSKSEQKKGQFAKGYAITLDFAKRIAMMARTEKGEEIRAYFIECEKAAKQIETKPMSTLDMLEASIKAIREQNIAIDEVMTEVKQLSEAVESLKVVNSEIQYFTIMGHCRNIKKQISLEQAKVYGIRCKTMCSQLGFVIGKVPDPRFGMVNTYPIDVLKEIIK